MQEEARPIRIVVWIMKWIQPKSHKQGMLRFLLIILILSAYMLFELIHGLYTGKLYAGFGGILTRKWVSYQSDPLTFIVAVFVHAMVLSGLIYGAHWAWCYYKRLRKSDG